MGRPFLLHPTILKIRISYSNGTMFTQTIIRGQTQTHATMHARAQIHVQTCIRTQTYMCAHTNTKIHGNMRARAHTHTTKALTFLMPATMENKQFTHQRE